MIPDLRTLLAALLVGVRAAAAQECAYEGGWALRNSGSCPPAAPIECGTGAQPRCCPSGYTCTGDGDYVGNYCCKDPLDCRTQSLEYPQCPDPSWTLYGVNGRLDNGGWCCANGTRGSFRDDQYGIALLCFSSAVSVLPVNISWATTVATSSCSTSTSSTSTPVSITSAITSAIDTAGTSATASETGSPSSSPSASTDPDSESSAAMSGGAIAGAAIGGVAGVALLIGGIFFVWRRKRRAAAELAAEPQQNAGWTYGGEAKYAPQQQQFPGELPTQRSHAEMDTNPTAYELDGSLPQELDSTTASSTPRPK
ncbi:hypothetical protein CMUS01_02747 [Colletotrichum musicola]|uniref:Uncharacterized protein n=1 Tax=Colletotrichum musicola TaxID=2175873 RepID=A0A8H6NUQ6_9PEZI|nr:hypothetical protein CMUS01_02747 [Colletotrichum musicola]